MRKPINRIEVVKETRELLVVEKPAGLLSVSTADEKEMTMFHLVHEYLVGRYGKNARVFIVHRLDRDTSGLMVFAKSYPVKEALQKLFEEGKIIRRYQAVLSCQPKDNEGTIVNYLKEDRFGNVFLGRPRDNSAAKAITKYRIVGRFNSYPEAEVEILTGKKNQIRIGFQSLGAPILGDKKYGGAKAKRLYLHACELDLRAYNEDPSYLTKSERCIF